MYACPTKFRQQDHRNLIEIGLIKTSFLQLDDVWLGDQFRPSLALTFQSGAVWVPELGEHAEAPPARALVQVWCVQLLCLFSQRSVKASIGSFFYTSWPDDIPNQRKIVFDSKYNCEPREFIVFASCQFLYTRARP